MTIRFKITFCLIVAAVIPLASAMLVAIRHATDHSKAGMVDTVESRLDAKANALFSFLNAQRSEVDAMAASPLMRSMDWDAIGPWARARLATRSDDWEKFILGDPVGHFYNTAGGNPGAGGLRTFDDSDPEARPKSIAKRDYWQQTVPGNQDAQPRSFISEPMISYTTGAKQIVVASSIIRDGEVVGMIGGSLPWGLFESRLSEIADGLRADLPDESAFSLIAPSGVYWHHTDVSKVVAVDRDASGAIRKDDSGESIVRYTSILDEPDDARRTAGADMVQGGRGVAITSEHEGGRDYLFYAPIGDTGYSMLLELPERAMMLDVGKLRRGLLLVLATTAPLAAIVAFFFARRITTPLSHLAEAAQAVTRGERASLPDSGEGEVRQVAIAFNRLFRWLEESNEQRAEADRLRFESVINQLADALAVVSVEGRVLHLNQPFERLIQARAGQDLIWEDAAWMGSEDEWRTRLDAVSRGTAVAFAYESIGEDQERTFEFSLSSISRREGSAVVVVGHDVTDRARQATLLARAMDEAEAASRVKSEFLANMSHEMRTPLTAILGFADVLHETVGHEDPASEQGQAVETIKRAGEHLLVVINDILDLSKIESGELEIERIEMSLVDVLIGVHGMMRSRIEGKGLQLSIHLDDPIPERIVGDPTRLRQILMNVLGNATKFTDAGRIETRVAVVMEQGEQRVRVSIEDTGTGMTPEQASGLFQPFAQADGSITRKHGGTGLGLSISRRLANIMDGDVWLESTAPGQGSKFVFQVPLHAAPGSAIVHELVRSASPESAPDRSGAAAPSPRLSGRILLAEDGPDNQRLIVRFIEKAGASVDVADHGQIALEMIDAADRAGRPYDLLITDMQMPVMDGYTLARTIKSRGSDLPIIALTANAMIEDRNNCLAAGCDDYATKPIDRATLIATCARWLPGGTAGERDAA